VNDEPDNKGARAPLQGEKSNSLVAQQEPQSLPQQFQILVDLEKQRIEPANRSGSLRDPNE
jgi:hypothetical protein